MNEFDRNRIKSLFLWAPWFNELATKIAEGTEQDLIDKAKSVNWLGSRSLLEYGDVNIDPFSFIYFLATKNTTKQFVPVYQSVHEIFGLESTNITEFPDDAYFPVPFAQAALFHNGETFHPELLWDLFRQAVNPTTISHDDFASVLKISGVGVPKLTQALYLINPYRYAQVDRSIEVILGQGCISKFKREIASEGFSAYQRVMDEMSLNFPECHPYEFNIFVVLQRNGFLIDSSSKFFEVSSEVFGDNEDVFDTEHKDKGMPSFEYCTCVYTPEPSSAEEPLNGCHLMPDKGDIILVRNGKNEGRGIAVVFDNEYQPDGWSENKAIRVIWINKTRELLANQIDSDGLSQIYRYHQTCRTFADSYPLTFKIIDNQFIEIPETNTLNTILYGPPGTGKTFATFRKCVDLCEGIQDSTEGEIRRRYQELRSEDRIEFVTFHQSYSYEEFVEGLRPESGSEGTDGFSLKHKDGVIKRIAERARRDSNRAYVLVIDEINRANVSKVLGELVTLLEEDKRQGKENEIAVTLPYSGDEFTLPANLFILGTMNTADRSIALLDTALRRRFQFEEMPPDHTKLRSIDRINLPEVLKAINDRLEWFIDRDHLIGHAWFMSAKTKADVDDIMHDKIIPLIVEYFYEDWEKVQSVLGGGSSFVTRSEIKTPPQFIDHSDEIRYSWSLRDSNEYTHDAYLELIKGKSSSGDS